MTYFDRRHLHIHNSGLKHCMKFDSHSSWTLLPYSSHCHKSLLPFLLQTHISLLLEHLLQKTNTQPWLDLASYLDHVGGEKRFSSPMRPEYEARLDYLKMIDFSLVPLPEGSPSCLHTTSASRSSQLVSQTLVLYPALDLQSSTCPMTTPSLD